MISTHLVGGQHEVRVFADLQSRAKASMPVDSESRGCLLPESLAAGAELSTQRDTAMTHVLGILHLRDASFRVKSISTYVYFLVWFAFSFLSVASENFGPVGNSNGKVLLNGPFAITVDDYRTPAFSA